MARALGLILTLLVIGLISECRGESFDDTPPLEDLLDFTSIEYERARGGVEARIVIDTGHDLFGMPEPETVEYWTDEHASEASILTRDTKVEVTTQREGSSGDLEIDELEFEWLGYSLGIDSDAVWKRGEVETRWALFENLRLQHQPDGAIRVEYVYSGDRFLGEADLSTENYRAVIRPLNLPYEPRARAAISRYPDFAAISASPEYEHLITELPIDAEVLVLEIGRDVRVKVP